MPTSIVGGVKKELNRRETKIGEGRRKNIDVIELEINKMVFSDIEQK